MSPRLLGAGALSSGAVLGFERRSLADGAPAIVTSDALRPNLEQGIQLGDVTERSAIVWTRSDKPLE